MEKCKMNNASECSNTLDNNNSISIEQTLEERGSKYGEFEDNANMTQSLMHIYSKGKNFEHFTFVHIELVHMIFHKLSRMVSGDVNYPDNARDVAGYAMGLTNFLEKLNAKRK